MGVDERSALCDVEAPLQVAAVEVEAEHRREQLHGEADHRLGLAQLGLLVGVRRQRADGPEQAVTAPERERDQPGEVVGSVGRRLAPERFDVALGEIDDDVVGPHRRECGQVCAGPGRVVQHVAGPEAVPAVAGQHHPLVTQAAGQHPVLHARGPSIRP